MVDFAGWLKTEWFSLIQTVGVIGGLIFTGATVRRDARAREAENLLAFAERHRSLWSEIAGRPELHRIIEKNADLSINPITAAEYVALNVVIVHYELGWRMARSADRADLKPLSKDVQNFFALPLPRNVWNATKDCHSQRFVEFVEKSIG